MVVYYPENTLWGQMGDIGLSYAMSAGVCLHESRGLTPLSAHG